MNLLCPSASSIYASEYIFIDINMFCYEVPMEMRMTLCPATERVMTENRTTRAPCHRAQLILSFRCTMRRIRNVVVTGACGEGETADLAVRER